MFRNVVKAQTNAAPLGYSTKVCTWCFFNRATCFHIQIKMIHSDDRSFFFHTRFFLCQCDSQGLEPNPSQNVCDESLWSVWFHLREESQTFQVTWHQQLPSEASFSKVSFKTLLISFPFVLKFPSLWELMDVYTKHSVFMLRLIVAVSLLDEYFCQTQTGVQSFPTTF